MFGFCKPVQPSIPIMKFAPLCALLFSATVLAVPAPVAAPVADSQVSYDGVKVYRIKLSDSQAQADTVAALVKKLNLETWTNAIKPNHNVDVQVNPADLTAFTSALTGLSYNVMHEDLGASIRAESEPVYSISKVAGDVNSKYAQSMTA